MKAVAEKMRAIVLAFGFLASGCVIRFAEAQPQPVGLSTNFMALWTNGHLTTNDIVQFARIAPDELINVFAFAEKLSRPSDSVSQYLAGRADSNTKKILSDFRQHRLTENDLSNGVVTFLNGVIGGPLIYESNRFRTFELSDWTVRALKLAPPSPTAICNRFLLEDVYPESILPILIRIPYYRVLYEFRDYRTFTSNLLASAKTNVNVAKLQEWAVRCLNENSTNTTVEMIDDDKVPPYVRHIGGMLAPRVFIIPNTCIMLDYGGGFGHYGFDVGPKDFRPTNDILYLLEWRPGVFAYRTVW